jgi:cathepsin B
MQVTGPPQFTTGPISLRNIASSLGALLPSEPSTEASVLGVSYIPPLNCKSEIIAPTFTAPDSLTLDTLPLSFSWRNLDNASAVLNRKVEKSLILPPGSQYACGSCWVWSTSQMLSDRYAILGNRMNPNLSPTYLLSCVGMDQNCSGGFPSDAGHFLEKQGIPSAVCWDYSWCSGSEECKDAAKGVSMTQLNKLLPECSTDQCQHNCDGGQCRTGGTVEFFKAKPGTTRALIDQRSIALDVYHHGPVATVMRIYGDFLAGSMGKDLYPKADGWAKTKGIYVHITGKDVYGYGDMQCLGANEASSKCFLGNHAVSIVGFGIEKNVAVFPDQDPIDLKYWIIRNSWGQQWHNDGGYFKLAWSDPDTGINMEVAADRPIRIGGKNFGGVTTLLPDVILDPEHPLTGAIIQSSSQWVARLKWIILVMLLFLGSFLIGHWFQKRRK